MAALFKKHPRSGFIGWIRLEKGKLVSREQQHHYYYQVQGQIAICSRKWCDFVAITKAGISIQPIFLDEISWTSKAAKLKYFYCTAIVPKLSNIL